MQKINISIDKVVSIVIHENQNQHYISPADISPIPSSPQLNPNDNQFITNNITPFKPPESTETNNNSTLGLVLLTKEQKIANMQQQIEDRAIYTKAIDKRNE